MKSSTALKLLLRRSLSRLALYGLLPLVLAGIGYGWWVWTRLDRQVAADDVAALSVSWRLVPPESSQVDTSLPRVVRAIVQRTDGGQNWLHVDGFGLAHGVYDWNFSQQAWQVVRPTGAMERTALELKLVAPQPVPRLLGILRDEDPLRREVAVVALRERTKQMFGFDPNGSAGDREAAVARWDAWWEENRIEYGARRAVEIFDDIVK